MNAMISTIRQPSDLAVMLYPKASVSDNVKTSPLEGGGLAFDSTMESIEQAKAVLLNYGIDAPEEILSQKFKMPEGLSDNEKYQWNLTSARLAEREFKVTTDKYYNTVASLPNDVIGDGRSHITSIHELIKNINVDYQRNFGDITKKATQYMELINAKLGKISSFTSAGSDGKIKFRPFDFLNEIDEAISKYTGRKYNGGKEADYFEKWKPDLSKAEPLKVITGGSKEFEFWKKKLDGQGFIVEQSGSDIKIFPDFKAITEIYNIVACSPPDWKGGDVLIQGFQSMQTGIDSQKNAVNNSISRLLETFRQDNSHFETLTQLLIQLLKDLFQYNAGFANI
ncbi:hypothetical protein [Providencia stuartii]|uniref:hypothetical protein n=1 Tax=Providencia stuartii TaxID=588 RepID=UPI00076B6096|nr:hypothetical protein [Providencia stuartii]AMG67832.1 hypothetical protein AL507_15180 [Providencia stuartii]